MVSSGALALTVLGIIMLTASNGNAQNILKIPKKGKIIMPTTNAPSNEIKSFKEKHLFTIHYEALCPDSERFMAQLGPVYESLKDYIQLEFVPFGLTKLLCKNVINGHCQHPLFTCKHGPIGCRTNRQHDCALQYSESQEKQMNFIMCTMGAHKAPIEKCLDLLGFSNNDVDICMTFDEGTELQLKSYSKTAAFKPKKLPLIVIDGQYSPDIQEAALDDFRVFACTLFASKYGLFGEKDAPMLCRTNEIFPSLQ